MKKKTITSNIIHLDDHKSAGSGQRPKRKRNSTDRSTKIITITSGKGGVGKTNIVANLGFTLCRYGKKVLILDADLGLGNLDVLLGLTPEYNLSDVIHGDKQLSDIIVEGPGRLKILPAASGIQELTQLSAEERYLFFSQLSQLIKDFDIVLIDTAAGISANVLFFNINADEILVVVTPEPTSITDAYALMKVLSIKYGTDQFKLVVNAAASEREADEVYRQLSLVADRFLNIRIEYYGLVGLDEKLKKGVRQQKVVSEMAPLARASRDFSVLSRKIANAETVPTQEGTSHWGLTDIPT
jgi:flagellar biosynthesis protein FlhG